MIRTLFSAVAGGLLGAGASAGYHVYNLKEDPEQLNWEEHMRMGLIGAAALVVGRNPSLLVKDLPHGYSNLVQKYPMTVKSLTTGVTYALGDLLAQWIEHRQEAKTDVVDGVKRDRPYDWKRAGVFLIFGCVMAGPVYTICTIFLFVSISDDLGYLTCLCYDRV
jgi:hypothetical protein